MPNVNEAGWWDRIKVEVEQVGFVRVVARGKPGIQIDAT